MPSSEVGQFMVRLPQPIEQRRQRNVRFRDGQRVDTILYANAADSGQVHEARGSQRCVAVGIHHAEIQNVLAPEACNQFPW